jgi:hypothetical protein
MPPDKAASDHSRSAALFLRPGQSETTLPSPRNELWFGAALLAIGLRASTKNLLRRIHIF